jgi:hypothetical protein
MPLIRAAILLPWLLLFGCTSVSEPVVILTASGTITRNGAPATADIELSANTFQSSRAFTGTYQITVSAIPESNCGAATLVAQLLDTDGVTVLDEQTRNLGECGDFEIDFEFD